MPLLAKDLNDRPARQSGAAGCSPSTSASAFGVCPNINLSGKFHDQMKRLPISLSWLLPTLLDYTASPGVANITCSQTMRLSSPVAAAPSA